MKTYTIKPLEWSERRNGGAEAFTPFGTYKVDEDSEGCSWSYCFDEYYDEGTRSCDSIEAGKQAAEEDWIDRITLALDEVQPIDDGTLDISTIFAAYGGTVFVDSCTIDSCNGQCRGHTIKTAE